jgi:transcriptional regulator with XRE-family HTH domain
MVKRKRLGRPLSVKIPTAASDAQILGKKIQAFRLQEGLSQMKLAKILKAPGGAISQAAVSRLESGRREPSLSEMIKIERLLKKDLKSLVKRGRG